MVSFVVACALVHHYRKNYDRARTLYTKALQAMERQGPDLQLLLYAYAIFCFVTGVRTCSLDSRAHYYRGYHVQCMVFNPRVNRFFCAGLVCEDKLRPLTAPRNVYDPFTRKTSVIPPSSRGKPPEPVNTKLPASCLRSLLLSCMPSARRKALMRSEWRELMKQCDGRYTFLA